MVLRTCLRSMRLYNLSLNHTTAPKASFLAAAGSFATIIGSIEASFSKRFTSSIPACIADASYPCTLLHIQEKPQK